MAKFTLEFDTVEKTLVASLDGKKLENVKAVNFYGGWGDEETFGMEVSSVTPSDNDGFTTVTRLVAGEKEPQDISSEKLRAKLAEHLGSYLK